MPTLHDGDIVLVDLGRSTTTPPGIFVLHDGKELNAALIAYLSEITEKVIREEVHKEPGEAEEVDEPTRIGR
jgi:phage repressor protein C with HTH and peptisase S24 domain